MCVTFTNLTSPDMTGYTLDSTAGACQQVGFTLPGHLFTLKGFPSVNVVLSVSFIPDFIIFMD